MNADLSLVKANELFSGLTDPEIETILELGKRVTLPRDTVICREGEEANSIFLVIDGRIVLRKNLDVPAVNVHRETPIGVCQSKQMVGWSALVEPYVYTLTGTTEKASTLIELPGRQTQRFLNEQPELGYKVMSAVANVMSRRLRQFEEAVITERALVIEGAREHSS